MVNFNISQKDQSLLDTVLLMIKIGAPKTSIFDIEMDLVACHCNGNPIDFEKMMFFDEFNFFHDLWGIQRHLDRGTGQLKNFFLPKCSK